MRRLLPLLLLVAFLAFSLRVGEVVTGMRDLSGGAIAADEKPKDASKDAPKAHASEDKTAKDAAHADKDAKADPKDQDSKKDKAPSGPSSWPDPTEMDPELARVRAGLVEDLAERRAQLDAREKDLATREAVLKAAESEIEQKTRELSELRKQLQGLLNQQSEEETARIKSLVRIYEGMKPADAARIFNTLEINILLDVMTRMSERKSAPILAAMEPDRARVVTLMMAQQKSLPELPPEEPAVE